MKIFTTAEIAVGSPSSGWADKIEAEDPIDQDHLAGFRIFPPHYLQNDNEPVSAGEFLRHACR